MLCKKINKADLKPFLALVDKNKYIAEEKYDGDRVRLRFENGSVTLTNRRNKNVSLTFPELSNIKQDEESLTFPELNAKSFLLDGEMCVDDNFGVSQFNEGIAFRTHCKDPATIKAKMIDYPVMFYVFDLLELNGINLRNLPLSERRRQLVLLNLHHPNLKVVEQHTDIEALFSQMCIEGREGIIIKDVGSLYREGYRTPNWRKVKNIKEADLVFTKYEENNAGITVENPDGIRCLVAGRHSHEVKKQIDTFGRVDITIRHLGKTKAGKYRQPVFMKTN